MKCSDLPCNKMSVSLTKFLIYNVYVDMCDLPPPLNHLIHYGDAAADTVGVEVRWAVISKYTGIRMTWNYGIVRLSPAPKIEYFTGRTFII